MKRCRWCDEKPGQSSDCAANRKGAHEWREELEERFIPGIYRHYKGARYLALFLTEDSNNGPNDEQSTQELEVVYIALDGPKAGQRCNRKLAQWNEQVEVWDVQRCASEKVKVPRFTLEERA